LHQQISKNFLPRSFYLFFLVFTSYPSWKKKKVDIYSSDYNKFSELRRHFVPRNYKKIFIALISLSLNPFLHFVGEREK